MKKFVHVYGNQIVAFYSSDEPCIFGGPWSEGKSYEVDPEFELGFIGISGFDEEGNPLFEQLLKE